MSGFEVCKQIKSDPALRRIFVAFHSGISTSSQAQTTGLDIGADGYIVKGIPANELIARVNSLLRIKKAEDALQQAHDELDQRVKERTAELLAANQRLVAVRKVCWSACDLNNCSPTLPQGYKCRFSRIDRK